MELIHLIAGGAIEEGKYGPVIIMKGKFKGHIGYYDDDVYESSKKAVVYFGHITKGFYEIAYSSMRHLSPKFEKAICKELSKEVVGVDQPD